MAAIKHFESLRQHHGIVIPCNLIGIKGAHAQTTKTKETIIAANHSV